MTIPQWLWPLGPNLLLATAYVAVVVWIVFQRFPHPYQLEWMEGGSLLHLVRLAEGKALYPAPSLDFVPFPYPPFYYCAALPIAKFIGFNFQALRLISVLSMIAVAILLYLLVRLETKRADFGLICVGMFASTYRASGGYMDVARIDSLYLALVLASVYLLRAREDWPGLIVAGMISFLAVMTKQTALVLFTPIYVWCFVREFRSSARSSVRWRRTIGFFFVPLLLVAVATLFLSRGENSHFLFYILGVQSGHAIRWSMLPDFFWKDLLSTLPVATLAAVAMGFAGWRRPERGREAFYSALLLGILLSSLIPRIKVGGAMNNLIPLHAGFALTGCVALALLLEQGPRFRWLPAIVSLALVLQFARLQFDPGIAIPRGGDIAAGRRLEKRLAAIDGEVLMPATSYFPGLVGKRVYAHQMPVDDLSRSGLGEAEALAESFASAIAAQEFEVIIDSTSRFLEHYPDDLVLRDHYRVAGQVFRIHGDLVPRSGWPVSPGLVWVPK